MIGLRTDDDVEERCSGGHGLALGLRDAPGYSDRRIASRLPPLAFPHLAKTTQFGVDLLGGFFSYVASIEQHEVGILEFARDHIAMMRQQSRHSIGIVNVHLATVSLDVEFSRHAETRC